MKNTILIFMIIISSSLYLYTSTENYKIDYRVEDLNEQIQEYEQKIDELIIDERIKLSREEAIKKYKLELNNNWYYLKDSDEQE